MKRYLLYIILVVLIAAVIFFLQDSQEYNWLRARLNNKPTYYAQYMKIYPNGWHFLEAQKRYDRLSWKNALKGGEIAGFQYYLKYNPDGFYVNDAYEKLQSLLWNQAAAKNTIEGYEQFINQYPNSDYVEQAKRNIEKLNWLNVYSKNNIEDLKKYIERYPDGEYTDEAKERLEDIIWDPKAWQYDKEKLLEYMRQYPTGKYIQQAQAMLAEIPKPWPVYIDSYHLYELTSFDKDYGYIFENQIKEILSKINNIEIVPEKSNAVVHLQIGYALDFRDGQTGEDNISKFIENIWRDRAIVKQERAKPTFDIGLHLYLWDVQSDCLLAFSYSSVPPDTGNAMPARTIGRDRFLEDQVINLLQNSIIPFLGNLQKGKDDVMSISGENKTVFFRHDIGKPKKRICLDFQNGPVTVYYWRDPGIERYIYYHLQQSDMDCVRTFDSQSFKLTVIWSKYDRMKLTGSLLREYGLQADFAVLEKNRDGKDRIIFNESIISDIQMEKYGYTPKEILMQWQKVFENSYVVGDAIKIMKKSTLSDEPQ
jgi:hypothetical protein